MEYGIEERTDRTFFGSHTLFLWLTLMSWGIIINGSRSYLYRLYCRFYRHKALKNIQTGNKKIL